MLKKISMTDTSPDQQHLSDTLTVSQDAADTSHQLTFNNNNVLAKNPDACEMCVCVQHDLDSEAARTSG